MGIFLVVISAFGFATLGIFGKWALDANLSIAEILLWRFVLAAPILMVIGAWGENGGSGAGSSSRTSNFLKSFILGFVGLGVESTLYFLTLARFGAALTVVLLYLHPMFIALIQHFFLKRKLDRLGWVCVFLSFLGCLLTARIVTGEGIHVPDFNRIQDWAIGIAMGFWYALYLLVGEKVSRSQSPIQIATGISFGAAVAFGIAVWFTTKGASVSFPGETHQWGIVLGLAVFSTAIPLASLYAGIKRIGVGRASVISTLELGFGLFLAMTFLHETLTLAQAVGAALIFVAVILISPKKGTAGGRA